MNNVGLEYYKRALLSRKEGEYTIAFAQLNIAYDHGNIYALVEMRNVCRSGGWGMKRKNKDDTELLRFIDHPLRSVLLHDFNIISPLPEMNDYDYTNSLLQNEINQGYVSVIHILAKRLIRQSKWKEAESLLEGGIKEGCAESSMLALRYFTENFASIPYKQKREGLAFELFMRYWNKYDYKQAMVIFTETDNEIGYMEFENLMIDDPNCKYYVGKGATKYISPKFHSRIREARLYYKQICSKRHKAVLAWMIVGKRLGICKDINLYIGKLTFDLPFSVWEERKRKKKNKR